VRIQILFDAVGPKAVSPFKAVSREATWNARPSRWKTFGEKFFKMIRLKREEKFASPLVVSETFSQSHWTIKERPIDTFLPHCPCRARTIQ